MMLNDSILITGSSGYIGSRFINQYHKKYQYLKFSLLSQKLEYIDLVNIDVILHCAALVHQKEKHSFEKYREINTLFPVELAIKAKAHGVKQFVFISTIAVSDETLEAIDRNSKFTPISFYGKSKLDAEKQLIALRDSNFKISIIRPPMVYGKNAPGNITPLIYLVKYFPIIPLGKIDNKRSFVYIDNLCHLINEVIRQEKDGIFFATDDQPISTSYLIKLISKGLNKKVMLIKIPFFDSLVKIILPKLHKRLFCSLVVDNTETKNILSLRNPISVEEGIRLMVKND